MFYCNLVLLLGLVHIMLSQGVATHHMRRLEGGRSEIKRNVTTRGEELNQLI
jgi:hypothetical protein